MALYILKRLLQTIFLLLFMTVIMFFLIHALPGGPDEVISNPHLSMEARIAIRVRFGLDQPLLVQYLKWVTSIIQGNFGTSFSTNQPVSEILSQRFPATLELFGAAFCIALLSSVLIGSLSAVHKNSVLDHIIIVLSYSSITMPVFLLCLLEQSTFGVWLHILPTSGMVTLGDDLDFTNAIWDHLSHLILPVSVLSIMFTAQWSRYVRVSMVETLSQDYICAAYAKGISYWNVIFRHALRNAVNPLITVIALDLGGMAGGAVVTESIFAWPGLGTLFMSSLDRRDYPVLLAILMLSSFFVFMCNLIADILYALVDPRIRPA